MPTLDDIRAAAHAIQGQVVRTPMVHASRLAARVGAEIALKLENRQHTGSFKDRGALNRLLLLSNAERQRGVIAVSAGNHAQGVAYHAGRLGITAIIVMPKPTPFVKIEATEALGAKVVLEGEDLSQAADHAARLIAERHLTLIHPYDDAAVIAGQGTIGLEMLEESDFDCLIVPIGGGGLIAGIATAVKALKPDIEIYGVEAALYPSMVDAISGRASRAAGNSLAEGIAVKQPGRLTQPIVEALVKEILLVSEGAIERAVQILVESEKIVAEGAAAAAVAALVENAERFRGRKVALVVTGGNIDSRVLASILMRGLARDGRLARLRIKIRDMPGTLGRVAEVIGASGANIIEVYHQRMHYEVPVTMADLDVMVETRNRQHVVELFRALEAAGYTTQLLSESSSAG